MGTVNKNEVTISTDKGNITLYFSYQTIVGFRHPEHGTVCRVNDWSTTTGKLLNEIQPDKSKRVPGPEFEAMLSKIFKA